MWTFSPQCFWCTRGSWASVRIDGGTSVEDRQTIVDNFNLRGIGKVGYPSCLLQMRTVLLHTYMSITALLVRRSGHTCVLSTQYFEHDLI